MNHQRRLIIYLNLAIFILVSAAWIFAKYNLWNLVPLAIGLALGSFFLDLDYLFSQLYLNPNSDTSRIIKIAWTKKDFLSLLKIIEYAHHTNTNLIFHHYFFQIVLNLISVFVFTSSSGIFIKSFLFALNLHLLTNQIIDYQQHPKFLQDWLFARESKQLPLSYLKHYLAVFVIFSLFFLFLLLKSRT